MFKEGAGQMRGFRIVRDPDGILFSPFDYLGTQMGYVLTYGEGIPAIHNGQDWVPVITEEAISTFEESLQSLIIEQGTKIAGAIKNPIYAELATQMGMYAGASVSGERDPGATTTAFGG